MLGRKLLVGLCVFALIFGLLITSVTSQAAEEDGAFYVLGSGLFSLLYLPIKLTTCVGTQTIATFAYVSTYNVPGNFEGGTNGKDIGEVAREACSVPWFISADQVKEDYE
jgi:hypothetical protein